jgi:hypothetical protein
MSDEPKRRLWVWLCWAIVGMACYPLSEAPVWRLTDDSRWWHTIEPAYAPVDWLFANCEAFRESMRIRAYSFSKHH